MLQWRSVSNRMLAIIVNYVYSKCVSNDSKYKKSPELMYSTFIAFQVLRY